ncbi:hypothetical protein M9H77_22813 [Catharanthus roseus]|uniref:Uncharacterized protein n=1 Tax=Catharanthus roseus TaxID=4058 RepID=A0ACC0ARJ0_CATRO|nr:hypothetical protein M9H77_22813 [Catharanthus roseus]
MLCRRHINQNVLTKLTEMIKDEEVASRFVNGSCHKLLNETDEAYLKKLDILKTKWHNRPDFLDYLFNTWLNPMAHKFVKVWTSQVLHFGVETINRAESEYSVLKLWLSKCHGNFDTMFLNIDSLIEELGSDHPCSQKKDIDSKMRDLAFLLDQISTGPMSKVTDTKGRRKTNSIKRDKSYWEHMSITHRKIQKSSGSSSGSGPGSSSGSGLGSRGRGRPPRAPGGRGRWRSSGRSSLSSLSSVIDPSTGSTFPCIEALPSFVYAFIEN